jgi:hypothetical protein
MVQWPRHAMPVAVSFGFGGEALNKIITGAWPCGNGFWAEPSDKLVSMLKGRKRNVVVDDKNTIM